MKLHMGEEAEDIFVEKYVPRKRKSNNYFENTGRRRGNGGKINGKKGDSKKDREEKRENFKKSRSVDRESFKRKKRREKK